MGAASGWGFLAAAFISMGVVLNLFLSLRIDPITSIASVVACSHEGANNEHSPQQLNGGGDNSRRSKRKDYTAPQGITLTGAGGNLTELKLNDPQCSHACTECLTVAEPTIGASAVSSRAYRSTATYFGDYYCYGYCDAPSNTCRPQSEGKKKDTDVDCTNCKAVIQREYFNPLEPVEDATATCGGIMQWGNDDEAKFLCKNVVNQWEEGCIIVSLGSNGIWGFETDAYKNSPCEIHTFDCTGSWPVPFAIGSRVTLHKKCVGTTEVPQEAGTKPGYGGVQGNRMITLDHVVDIVGGRPDYLKVDVEGYEWALLPSLMANSPESLPAQIQVEIHWTFPSSLGQMMENLRERYAVLKRRDNPHCFHCTEILLVLKDRLLQR